MKILKGYLWDAPNHALNTSDTWGWRTGPPSSRNFHSWASWSRTFTFSPIPPRWDAPSTDVPDAAGSSWPLWTRTPSCWNSKLWRTVTTSTTSWNVASWTTSCGHNPSPSPGLLLDLSWVIQVPCLRRVCMGLLHWCSLMDTLVLQDILPTASSGGTSLHPDPLHGPQFPLVVHFGVLFLRFKFLTNRKKKKNILKLLHFAEDTRYWSEYFCSSMFRYSVICNRTCPHTTRQFTNCCQESKPRREKNNLKCVELHTTH